MDDIAAPKFKYHVPVVLVKPLEKCECWNFTDGKYASFAVGEEIKPIRAFDATHTTFECKECDADGRPVCNADGSTYAGSNGYRFIADNNALAEATGLPIPEKVFDLVGQIMAYESGELDEAQTQELMDYLRTTGIGKQLQGRYSSRM